MGAFLDRNFLLQSDQAQRLYHDYAAAMPILDYHNHLSPKDIAEDRIFTNLTAAWLEGDHYKWRAMRANGIPEHFITGKASDEEKFQKWAETVPYTLRNPLYHWTHLELQRYFDIHDLLSPKTAAATWEKTSDLLQQPAFSARNLLLKMQVRILCTTDDPTDNLEWHRQIRDDQFGIRVLPTFRPDRAMAPENTVTFNTWTDRLSMVTDIDITSYQQFITALENRHQFFADLGCQLSDHGIETFYAEEISTGKMQVLFDKIRTNQTLSTGDIVQFKSGMMLEFARMNHEKGWTQQYHVGPLRNTNPHRLRELGPDTGFDSIGDFRHGAAMARFFATLEERGHLPKTIIYNINPADNYLFAGMTGNFQDGSVPGKIQFGSGWWFLDQKEGIEWQLNALSNMGLLSRFVGMLTDSRSFLSFPRHEYFRRILCNILGGEMEQGLLPDDVEMIGAMVKNIAWHNAEQYFGFNN